MQPPHVQLENLVFLDVNAYVSRAISRPGTMLGQPIPSIASVLGEAAPIGCLWLSFNMYQCFN